MAARSDPSCSFGQTGIQTIAIRALDHDHTQYWGKSEEAFDFIGIILTQISVIVDIGKIFCHE